MATVLSLVWKIAPCLFLLLLGFGGGFYLEDRLLSGQIATMKAQAAVRQAARAKAAAAQDAAWAATLANDNAAYMDAEHALQIARRQSALRGQALRQMIGTEGKIAKDNGPVAPVLTNTLNALRAQQGGAP
jgi:RecA/RadA recombinase